jgi:hypothetical protein
MELYFMVLAILLLTLIACYAIRQEEAAATERLDLDRYVRNPPLAQSNRESDETQQGDDIVGYLRPQ